MIQVEICEQLIKSWLKNFKNCQIVETNWKISPLWQISGQAIQNQFDSITEILNDFKKTNENGLEVELDQDDNQEDIFVDEQEELEKNNIEDNNIKNCCVSDIIKKSKPVQFINQCEIDNLGINIDANGKINNVYFIDSAFHINGLGYHNVVETVIKKILRAVAVSNLIFSNNVKVTIAFASPIVKKTPKSKIENVVNFIEKSLNKKYPNIKLLLYFEDDFINKIYKPFVELYYNDRNKFNSISDIFVRSYILNQISLNKINVKAAVAYQSQNVGTNNRSKAKYQYNGTVYSQSRLVLKVVKDFIGNQPGISFSALKNAFPDGLMGTLGVVKRDFEIKDPSRYFVKAGEEIKLDSGDIVYVCNQWQVIKTDAFVAHMRKHNYNIIKI